MPIYEYRCELCEEEFEKLVRLSTPDEEVPCPQCGGQRSQRRMSVFASSGGSRAGTTSSACAPRGGFS